MGFTWEDQLRVPKGNGRFSGRWVDMPWRTASKLMKALADIDSSRGLYLPDGKGASNVNGNLRDAIGEALKAATKAEGRARAIDFDPSDHEVGSEAKRVTGALERAYNVVRRDADKLTVLDLNAGAEVEGEAKSAYLAEYADALLDAHMNADLFSSTDWAGLPRDDDSVLDGAKLDNEFPIDGEGDGGGDSNLLERAAKKAGWEVVEAVHDNNDNNDDNNDENDDEGDDEPLPTEPMPVPDFGPEDGLERATVVPEAPYDLVMDSLDALAFSPSGGGTDAFRPDLADALRNDWMKGLLGTVQTGPDSVDLVALDGTIIATVSLDGTLTRGPGYEAWVEGAQARYPGHRLWQSSDAVIRDIIGTEPALANQTRKESTMSVQSRFAEGVTSTEAAVPVGGFAPVSPISSAPSLLASAAPSRPPAEWFADPKLAMPTGLVVTPDGRVYGHVASWGVCHIAHTQQCITAPHSRTGYAYFRTGSVLTSEGSQIPVGRITLDTVHAGPKLNALSAQQHYENTGAAVADVACGEDQWGIWIAGAVRPSASDDQVRALRAAPLSGDWREMGGNLELVAALSVNVPGFPIPRPTGLVASGVLRSLVASGMVAPEPPHSRLEALALRGHTPTTAADIEYLKALAAKAAAVVAGAAEVAELAVAVEPEVVELTDEDLAALADSDLAELGEGELAELAALTDGEMDGEVVDLDPDDCGCEAEGEFTVADLDPKVLELANRQKIARMAARVRELASVTSVVSDPAAMIAYGCNCRSKTRPMGLGTQKATTTVMTTPKPKPTYSYTPPSGPVVRGSLLEVRAAAKRDAGGAISPA